MEEISLRFDGREASKGRLHFYEYTRSQYATARFITTIEHFRRTGNVAPKVTSSSYVDVYVETPKEGSFLEILLVKAQEAAATAVAVPLTSLISLVWDTILPRSESTDADLVEMARIQLAEKELQLRQSEQETERMRVLKEIIESNSATTQQALSLTEEALKSGNAAYGRAGLLGPRISEISKELGREKERQGLTDEHRRELEKIPPEKLAKLTSRLRPMIPEMALPLKRSADSLQVEGGKDRKPLLLLNPRNVAEIVEKEIADETIELPVHVRSYDRDRGVGKVTSSELPRQLNFVVPPSEQSRLLLEILDAMAKETVVFVCRMYRDKSGQPTSILLEDVVPM